MFNDTLSHYPRMKQTQARLVSSTQLKNGMALARWSNQEDRIEKIHSSHHTLSVYLNGAENSLRRQGSQTIASKTSNSMCLMPANLVTDWDVHGPVSLLHFYFSDTHLSQLIEQVWDKDGRSVQLDEIDFAQDALLTQLFCTTLGQSNWQDPLDQLALDSATQTALIHTLRHYSQRRLPTLRPTGGLPAWQLKRVVEFIEHHLSQPLTLADMANVTGLSDYHFARMFKQATGYPPHRYVLRRRLTRARHLLAETSQNMTEIALRCGFGSSSHFSKRFRAETGVSPTEYRTQQRR
ncbi:MULTISPECIES: AraC family transcriptional regulator [unclassified Halomonas]|uniref:helix-turn-helix domain-containing protein n=1 Tax=unclassified Halomonas TaxID=2609666 RepID=UPI000AF1682D|nr:MULTISPECIES: AraC family transcriptional regulator [unclassified Halomonas]MBT2785284.1 helix-turn-helix transcriptional regulator [Halomonas sp. ISL-106]MBT2799305.1 helix-turn-helix transcriptional regulator [Halomonas sp. ISL-104]